MYVLKRLNILQFFYREFTDTIEASWELFENYVTNTVGRKEEAALNNNRKKLTDFCTCNNLKITNTFFKQKEILKGTSKASGHKSSTDYFVTHM